MLPACDVTSSQNATLETLFYIYHDAPATHDMRGLAVSTWPAAACAAHWIKEQHMSKSRLLAAPLATVSFAALALALSGHAQAAGNATEGLYIGAGTGFSSLKNDDSDEAGDFIDSGSDDFDVDDDDNVYKAFVGYQYNPYFATEAFYTDLGTVQLKGNDFGNTDLKSKAYGVNVVGILPIGQYFSLFAKAGMAKWETDVDGNLGDSSVDLKDNDGFDPVYGAGAQVNLDPFLIRAEYERYDFDSDYQVDAFTASVGYKF
jgi:hypothetical protein